MIIDFYLPDGTFLDSCTEPDNDAGAMLRLLCRKYGAVVVREREVDDVAAIDGDDELGWLLD